MNPTFNLAREPWMPCIQGDGAAVDLGLRDALVHAHELRELQGESPLVIAALHRLLLAVLHRVFGPAGYDEWAALWEAGCWDPAQVDAYFEQWCQRFDLFDVEHPFYQTADDRVRAKSVGSLIHDVASGNNPTLFDHNTDTRAIALDPSRAARLLLAAQAYGLSGLCAPGLPNFTYGACVRGVVFLAQGSSLFETLALNLLPYPDEAIMTHYPDDRPIWEARNPFAPNRSRPMGYLDYLTWPNRRVLFIPSIVEDDLAVREMTVAPGLALSQAIMDPMMHYFKDERRGPLPLRLREERALWRDSAALFELRNPAFRPPAVLSWISELIDEGHLHKDKVQGYLAFGIGIGKKAADVDFYRSERLLLPLVYLKDAELLNTLRAALDMAEKAAGELSSATFRLALVSLSREISDDDWKNIRKLPESLRKASAELERHWGAARRYWSRLELPFRETMEAVPKAREAALGGWRTTLVRTAWTAFDEVADNLSHDPRQLKAVVRGRDQLAAGLGKALPA